MSTFHYKGRKVFNRREGGEVITCPTQGMAGWLENLGGRIEMVFISLEWIPTKEHRKASAELREANRNFYKAHPHLLRQKINERGLKPKHYLLCLERGTW